MFIQKHHTKVHKKRIQKHKKIIKTTKKYKKRRFLIKQTVHTKKSKTVKAIMKDKQTVFGQKKCSNIQKTQTNKTYKHL